MSLHYPYWNYRKLLEVVDDAIQKHGDKLREVIISIDCRESILQADSIDVKDQYINGIRIIMEPFIDTEDIQFVLAEEALETD